MGDQMFFTKKPGQVPVNEEENALLFGDSVPDTVVLPRDLGGQVVRVVRAFTAPCPETNIPCRHLELENDICVAESNKFYWYRKRNA